MFKRARFGSGASKFYEKNKLKEDPQFRAAVLKTSPCVVGIASLGISAEMATKFESPGKPKGKDNMFLGSGIIIECDQKPSGEDAKFSATILTTACLFYRFNLVQPSDIEVDVYLPSREICKGAKVFACDFHYNLALLSIRLDAALQPRNLRDLNDTMSIIQPSTTNPDVDFQLSTPFKIRPGDYVAALLRRSCSSFDFHVSLCRFSVTNYRIHDCNELYSLSSQDNTIERACGGPVINCHGEVVGITALENNFIPTNVVSRWWNSYKNCKEFRRPWLGLNVANLHSADFNFLERFLRAFPAVSSGIIVKKVLKNSAAHSSGLLGEDVIVQCNGAAVGSTLDFFDKIWGRVGELVELSILRGAGRVNVKVTVGEPTPNQFYCWSIPKCMPARSSKKTMFYDHSCPRRKAYKGAKGPCGARSAR